MTAVKTAPCHILNLRIELCIVGSDVSATNLHVITSAQMRAARAMLGLDQRGLAQIAGLSLPTIQRMEASDGVVRGNVDSLMKLVGALQEAGIELIAEGAASAGGGRGVRVSKAAPPQGNASRRA